MTAPRFLPSIVASLVGKKRLARWGSYLPRIAAKEELFRSLDDAGLRRESQSLRYRARSGEPLVRLLPEAYALVRQSAGRTLGLRHYDVQLLGGVAMHFGNIAEMQTGEGKTLAATLPLYLAALPGQGAHLATANDYLARRDADWTRPLYDLLGISVGVVDSQNATAQRRKAYQCDVTYGTAKELGFDFLRDRLSDGEGGSSQDDLVGLMLGGDVMATNSSSVQRRLNFALVDEADSILIDESRTPLIVSSLPGSTEDAEELYNWAASVAAQFAEAEHFDYDDERRVVTLSVAGRRLVRRLPRRSGQSDAPMWELYEHIELAIRARRDYLLDRHYVVRDGEVVIVDENTGRLAIGRRWRGGIHQAVEAKEGVDISHETGDAARVTIQDYFRLYRRLSGMTGTAASARREFRSVYRIGVVEIPTNKPACRAQLPDRVFGDGNAKWQAIIDEIQSMRSAGRPVLVGTRSIDRSEHLSKLLDKCGVAHQVLNARHLAPEAEIVAGAGQSGKVTVATNMAGRGTDIRLDDSVRRIGGLHVICCELHESRRIDRQLIGRCGRQGDPGSYRMFMALDDDILLAGLGSRRAGQLRRLGANHDGPHEQFARLFRKAQHRIERRHFLQRRALLLHESERRKLQEQMGQNPYLESPG